jgi:hypothetical protein
MKTGGQFMLAYACIPRASAIVNRMNGRWRDAVSLAVRQHEMIATLEPRAFGKYWRGQTGA